MNVRNETVSGARAVPIEEALPERWGADVDSIAKALHARVVSHARRIGASTVRAIRLRLGERVAFSDDELVASLARLSRNGPLANAKLVIERIPVRWFCPGCDRTLRRESCRSCGLPGILEAGEERILDSMEC